jgi:succinate-acetate transporter protein
MSDTTSALRESGHVPGAHIADPAPLGLGAFALTTFVLSMVNSDIVPQALVGGALGLALAYGGIAQFTAGVWEFAKGNTFGATAFCSHGAFWVSFWWLAEKDLGGLAPTATRPWVPTWWPGRSSPPTCPWPP